jgi:uracil-DNA glycosylase
MLDSVNLQDVKEKIIDKLAGSGWGNKLRTFIKSSEMDNILETLLKEALDNKRFTPKVKDMFNAFDVCPYDKTRVVIIGQDPYPQAGVADGIAFSCSNTGNIEASLRYMHKSIIATVDPNYIGQPDLRHWSDQGVLLLNTALTTTIGKPGSHQLLWRSFIVQVLDSLIWEKPGLIYVFLGKKAQELADLIPDNNYKIMVSHPASAAYNKESEWDCNDMWNKINKYLEQDGQQPISW